MSLTFRYEVLAQDEKPERFEETKSVSFIRALKAKTILLRILSLLLVALIIIAIALGKVWYGYAEVKPIRSKCSSPAVRSEWRTLNSMDQRAYIRSVLCLHEKASRLGLNQSLYDDFSYIHYLAESQCECWPERLIKISH